MRRLLSWTAIAILTFIHIGSSAKAATPCQQTAQDVSHSCQLGADSDYQLALGKCDNVSDPTAGTACQRQASADQRDAQLTCHAQFEARDDACDRLGGAPYDPVIDPKNFVATITNPYFPLKPGTNLVYEGKTPDGFNHTEFFVTRNTRVILGVTCVEVHDTVLLDGKLSEDTLDWFAQDRDGNVWYFGENTHELQDGLITSIDGTFLAGVDRAKAGIIMKAHPAIGDFYRQEFDLGNAEDFADTLSLTETVTVPAGTFTRCLKSQETTPLETDLLEHKFYAPGVGNVLTVNARTGDRIELVRITNK